jgi:hypothetical protein
MQNHIENAIQTGYSLRIGDYFREGWELIRPNIMLYVGFTLLIIAVSALGIFIPGAGLLVSPVATYAYINTIRRTDRGEYITFSTFFEGLTGSMFGHLLLVGLVSGLLIGFGIVFCIIPGIYLAIAYTFANIIVVLTLDKEPNFWEAMELSRRLVSKNWFEVFIWLLVVGFAFMFLIIFTLGLGLFIITPWTAAITYVGFKDITKFDGADNGLKTEDHFLTEM